MQTNKPKGYVKMTKVLSKLHILQLEDIAFVHESQGLILVTPIFNALKV